MSAFEKYFLSYDISSSNLPYQCKITRSLQQVNMKIRYLTVQSLDLVPAPVYHQSSKVKLLKKLYLILESARPDKYGR